MGIIQSVICSVTFCVERVLTWACCAFLLMTLMFSIVVLMIYGISVGYHYAQKELAMFAMASRSTTGSSLRSGAEAPESRPVVRLVAVNRTQVERAPAPLLEVYQKKPGEQVYIETTETPMVVLETERAPVGPPLSSHEQDLARRLIGRFRRSRSNSSVVTNQPPSEPPSSSLVQLPSQSPSVPQISSSQQPTSSSKVPFFRPLRTRPVDNAIHAHN